MIETDKKSKSKRAAEDDIPLEEAMMDSELENQEMDGKFADGNLGLDEDGVRDLGTVKFGEGVNSDDEDEDEEDDDMDEGEYDDAIIEEENEEADVPRAAEVFRPGIDKLEEGEVLELDPTAYVMYHSMDIEWPFLSFDLVPDRLGPARTKFPLSAYMVAGTQADSAANNRLLVMRIGNLTKTQESEDSEDEWDLDDDDDDELPVVDVVKVPHQGGVNRVRVMNQEPNIVATWADTGKVHLWDVRPILHGLEKNAESGGKSNTSNKQLQPCFTFSGHKDEGYALDWSKTTAGRLATGDCSGGLHVWDVDSNLLSSLPTPNSSVWTVDPKKPYKGHKGSVEDIQWSHGENTVFATCSTDQTIKIWDTRHSAGSMLSVKAHDSDVNVINWSPLVSYLMVSGADDGTFKIWDLRNFKSDAPIAMFSYHNSPITSVEWSYDDENVLCVASSDNSVTMWDMSLEQDDEAEVAMALEKGIKGHVPASADPKLADVPPQLLFVHQGQNDNKEAHFHRQIPGVVFSTAADSFNIWKPDVYTTA